MICSKKSLKRARASACVVAAQRILRMVMTKRRDDCFSFIRLGEIALTYF
jgi:hypothetical protein